MARGSEQAQTGATSAQNLSNNLQGQSNALYSTLAPELESEAAHPAGFNPTETARMKTAAQQTAGGSMAGAVGQGSLLAGRTRNPGSASAAIEQSARDSGETLSKSNLGIENQDAQLKQAQRRAALGSLAGLYGTGVGASVGSLGEVANNVNANTNASNASWNWARYLLDPAMAGAAQGAGMAAQ